MPPSVTVFTTFAHDVAWLEETIASVLAQTFEDFEYILVNDGDPKVSRGIESRFGDARLRVIDVAPSTVAAKRALGLTLAKGKYVAMIDADDVCEPERLRVQVEFLEKHDDHVLVGSAVTFIDECSRVLGSRRYPEDDADIRRTLPLFNCIAQPSVMARRSALLEVGGYSTRFPLVEDYDLWLRLARRGKLHNFTQPLIRYRLHERANKSRQLKRTIRDSVRVKLCATREYGYRWSFALVASLAAHLILLVLPTPIVSQVYRRIIVR